MRELKLLKSDEEIITLNQVKRYLRIMHDDDNDLLELMMKTACEVAENYLGKAIINSDYVLSLKLPQEIAAITLPKSPIREINEITIIDYNGNKVTLDPSFYYLNSLKRNLRLTSNLGSIAKKPKELQIYFSCGFKMSEVKPSFQVAAMIHIAAMYDCRGVEAELPRASRMLYSPYREVRV